MERKLAHGETGILDGDIARPDTKKDTKICDTLVELNRMAQGEIGKLVDGGAQVDTKKEPAKVELKRMSPSKALKSKNEGSLTRDPMETTNCENKISVKGVEIRDLRSYLARKKSEREKKYKKIRDRGENQVSDHRRLPEHGDQHHEDLSIKKTATGGKTVKVEKVEGKSNAKGGTQAKLFEIFNRVGEEKRKEEKISKTKI